MSNTTQSQFKHSCEEKNARKFWHWIKTRGGIAVWKSVNLSNPGASWSSPVRDKDGNTYGKPNWQSANEPVIFDNPDEVGVYQKSLYKAVPVALRRSGNGLTLKLTDASQRKVDKLLRACEEKHGDSFYERGTLDIEGASIGVFYSTGEISLTEWIRVNGEGQPEDFE